MVVFWTFSTISVLIEREAAKSAAVIIEKVVLLCQVTRSITLNWWRAISFWIVSVSPDLC